MAAKGKKSRKKRKKKGQRRRAGAGGQAGAATQGGSRAVKKPKSMSATGKADPQTGGESAGAPVSDGAANAPAGEEPKAEAPQPAVEAPELDEDVPEQPAETHAPIGASSEAHDVGDEDPDVFDLDAAVRETALDLGQDLSADELIAKVATDAERATGEHAMTGESVRPDAGVPDSHGAGVTGDDVEDDADPSGPVAPPSSPEERARLLAAASAYAEMQDARYRVPTESRRVARLKGWIALTGFAIAGLLAIAPPEPILPEPSATLDEADRLRGLYVGLLLQAEQVEAFRVRELRLPDALTEVAARVPGVRFVKSGNRVYQLIAYTGDGRAVVYDSAAPAAEFEGVERAWAIAMGS